MQKHFTIPLSRERVASCRKVAPQLSEVIDLTVKHHGHAAVRSNERLSAPGNVYYRQSAMTEANRAIEKEADVIGPAIHECRRHQRQRVARLRIVT
jgi:hypothetical protein